MSEDPGHRLPLPERAGKASGIDKSAEYETFENALGLLVVRHLEIDPPEVVIKAMTMQIAMIRQAYRADDDIAGGTGT